MPSTLRRLVVEAYRFTFLIRCRSSRRRRSLNAASGGDQVGALGLNAAAGKGERRARDGGGGAAVEATSGTAGPSGGSGQRSVVQSDGAEAWRGLRREVPRVVVGPGGEAVGVPGSQPGKGGPGGRGSRRHRVLCPQQVEKLALGAWRHRPVRNAARAACHSSNFLKSFDDQAARAWFSCRLTNQRNQLRNESNHPW